MSLDLLWHLPSSDKMKLQSPSPPLDFVGDGSYSLSVEGTWVEEGYAVDWSWKRCNKYLYGILNNLPFRWSRFPILVSSLITSFKNNISEWRDSIPHRNAHKGIVEKPRWHLQRYVKSSAPFYVGPACRYPWFHIIPSTAFDNLACSVVLQRGLRIMSRHTGFSQGSNDSSWPLISPNRIKYSFFN